MAAGQITLVPPQDPNPLIAGESASISGFALSDARWTRQSVRYAESASVQGLQGTRDVAYSRATAVFDYSPDASAVFLKWLLPLIVVMGVVVLAPSIDGTLGDVRLAIPSAALLTLVVLHGSYKGNFPPAPYLTYLDELYGYSYIVCFVIFLLFLVGTNAHAKSKPDQVAQVNISVNRLDLIVQSGAMIGFAVVALVGWFN